MNGDIQSVSGQAAFVLWTSSFSEQLVHMTGSIFFLIVNTENMHPTDFTLVMTIIAH